jgi:hypothetical protein
VHRLLGLLILGLVCTIGLSTTGCKKKEEPAKADKAPSTGDKGVAEAEGAVVYDVTETIIVLKPGEKKDVELTRKGKTLKGVTVKGESSEPKVHVKTEDFKDDAKAAKVTIHADEKAPPGKHTVTLTPDDGKKTTIEVEVMKAAGEPEPKVKGKDKGETEPKTKKDKGEAEPKTKGKDKGDKGALNLRRQRDAYVALGREELQAATPSLTRRQVAWFIREA